MAKDKQYNPNIYDISETIQMNGFYYERLFDHPEGHEYRCMQQMASEKFQYVTNKNTIKQLDKKFRPRKEY